MMEKKYARLAALLTVAVLCGNGAPSMAANEVVTEENGWHTVIDSDHNGSVYGNPNNPDANGIVTGHVEMTGGTVGGEVYGGFAEDAADVKDSTVTITGGTVDSSSSVYGGCGNGGEATGNRVTITGGTVTGYVYGGRMENGNASGNTVTISDGTVNNGIYGGWGYTDATNNRVTITGGTVKGDVYGGRMENGNASGNTVTISGGKVGGDVYGGWSWNGSGEVSGNTVALLGSANVSEASLYGSNKAVIGYDGNTLLIDGWSGSAKSVKNFDEVTFRNIRWQTGGTVLNITNNTQEDSLENTTVKVEQLSMAGGTELQTDGSMTFIKGDNLGIQKGNVDVADTFTAGVAAVGTGEMSVSDDGNTLSYKITGVFRNRQTDLIAENRAVAAAFVNQGADIAADSLRLLDDGYHFGMQTFGAVYGNRSTYDVASDIKINGWSEIAGFGNIHEVKGGRLAWGVFYENGTGNYRTWNTFNNEMFRGDGSLLYNGGGAAVRLTKDSGMYYEASLRAGTLSSSMSNAVKDGNGNSYGFDSDSTYWGAHLGAGKLIQRGSGQWDIYGKYFHTDIDGDSFEMGGDRFSFDSVTSDRLRLGARYTADTDKAWSLYCGAAYEYEFSGDSHMKAGQFDAPEQSLQGSTVFGEIGTVWGRKDSSWSMDINLRGYAGEREGFSGMVQLAYAF